MMMATMMITSCGAIGLISWDDEGDADNGWWADQSRSIQIKCNCFWSTLGFPLHLASPSAWRPLSTGSPLSSRWILIASLHQRTKGWIENNHYNYMSWECMRCAGVTVHCMTFFYGSANKKGEFFVPFCLCNERTIIILMISAPR